MFLAIFKSWISLLVIVSLRHNIVARNDPIQPKLTLMFYLRFYCQAQLKVTQWLTLVLILFYPTNNPPTWKSSGPATTPTLLKWYCSTGDILYIRWSAVDVFIWCCHNPNSTKMKVWFDMEKTLQPHHHHPPLQTLSCYWSKL